ncbi:hypothetical protein B0T09DRAFT_357786 [Sordaria sp. MPI-SDFR-AT-0083]|nr:hypothetical protein B0T09DRAFT_357786 [Sordaria sp. MPI-SDFR-AT-0083]
MDPTPPPTMNGIAEGPCMNTQCARSQGILQGVNDTLLSERTAAVEEATTLGRENIGLRADIARLRADIEQLREQVVRVRAGPKKHTERAWPGMVRQHLLTGDPTWEEVCGQCNKEENMSVNINRVHPNIKFVTREEGDAAIEDLPGSNINNGPFNFNGLPAEVQARIFKIWPFKKGKLVHAISRLDPFVPLKEFPEEAALSRRSGLKRFFFFERKCSITHSGQAPNDLLRMLLVSRRFYFIGIHAFCGLNTFAFSSLGEFHRFCQGIGPARVERLQHLEITLTGNQYLTVALDPKGRLPYSRRTFGLSFLPDCQRLKTLVIHIDESGKRYQRRRYGDSNYKHRRESSKLENLQPLFRANGQEGAWNPVRADWGLVKGFYIDNGGIWSYDQLRQDGGLPHDTDVPSRMSASSGPRQRGSSSSSSSLSSSSSFSSSSSSSGGPHHGRRGPPIGGPGDADMERNSPPDGRAGSEIIEVPSDSDSDEDSLFVSQNNRHNDHLEYNSNRSRHSTSPGTGDAGTPMAIDDEDNEDDHNPHHQHHNSSPSPSPHPS